MHVICLRLWSFPGRIYYDCFKKGTKIEGLTINILTTCQKQWFSGKLTTVYVRFVCLCVSSFLSVSLQLITFFCLISCFLGPRQLVITKVNVLLDPLCKGSYLSHSNGSNYEVGQLLLVFKMSQNVPKCPKMSQNVPKCPKMSQNIPTCCLSSAF